MREYNYSFVSRRHWPGAVSILASTHEPKDTRMWGCEDTSKRTWIWGYEDASIQANTYEPEDVRMQGYKQAHTGTPAMTYEHEVTRI